MLHYEPWHLRHPEDIPESDETPVDSEDQNLIPNLLLATLLFLWGDRMDWFFAVDMLILPDSGEGIVPDAFLSLGVPRRTREHGRLSYILRNENDVSPILTLEMVSQTYREEYSTKLEQYAQLGVLYYVIYNPARYGPRRRASDRVEVYRLEQGVYRRIPGDPVWMPEIGLGIGSGTTWIGGMEISCLFWFDEQGHPYPHGEERIQEATRQTQIQKALAEQERIRAEQERIRAEQAEARAVEAEARAELLRRAIRAQGLDLDQILTELDQDLPDL